MTDVFISYAREDRDQTKILADMIVSARIEVWWDTSIEPGRNYEDVIDAAIASANVSSSYGVHIQ
jgi:hypothetical protein